MEWVWRPAVRSRIMAAKVPSSLLLETTPVSTTHHTLPPSSWLLRAPAPDSLSAPGTQRSWETLPVKKGRRELGEQMATCQSPHFPFCVSVSVCMTPSSLLYSQNQAQCPEHSRCSVSEGQVPQLCPILCDPRDCSLPGSSVHRNSTGKNIGVGCHAFLQGPNLGIEPRSPTLQADSLPTEPQGKLKNIGVGSLSLLQQIFLIQESNWGLPHCRQILYQLSYEESCF